MVIFVCKRSGDPTAQPETYKLKSNTAVIKNGWRYTIAQSFPYITLIIAWQAGIIFLTPSGDEE